VSKPGRVPIKNLLRYKEYISKLKVERIYYGSFTEEDGSTALKEFSERWAQKHTINVQSHGWWQQFYG